MSRSYRFHGRTFSTGDRIVVNSEGSKRGFGEVGEQLTIGAIARDKGNDTQIGIVADTRRSRWHDLDGQCDSNCGYWISVSNAYTGTDPAPKSYVIGGDFAFKRHNLRGKNCRQVGVISGGAAAIVELEENVGGGSGDGLGKHGHCVLVPMSLLSVRKQRKQSE